MLIAIVLLNACMVFGALVGVIYVKRRIRLLKQSIIDSYVDFISVESDQKGSKLQQTIDSAAHIMAQRFINTMSASAMQSASVDSRLTNQLEKDIASDMLNANNPEIGIVLEMMPTVKKRLMKNPALIHNLMPIVGKYMRGYGKGGSVVSNSNGKASFTSRIGQG